MTQKPGECWLFARLAPFSYRSEDEELNRIENLTHGYSL